MTLRTATGGRFRRIQGMVLRFVTAGKVQCYRVKGRRKAQWNACRHTLVWKM